MSTAIVRQAYQSPAVAAAYDTQRFSGWVGRTFDRLEKRAIHALLWRALGRDRSPTVLDVPCGTGRITQLLLQMGFDAVGGDVSPPMLRLAQHKCRPYSRQARFQLLDLERLDLADGAFELVTCVRLMHHLGSPQRAAVLKELSRVSKRWVLINVSYSSPYYRLRRRAKRWLGQGVSRESTRWHDLRREARQAGLRVWGLRFAARWLSEDFVVLLEKTT